MQHLVAAIVFLWGMAGDAAWAGTKEDAFDSLVKSRSLKCAFPLGSSMDWYNAPGKLKQSDEGMAMHFDSIDLKTRKARAIGNQMATDVSVQPTASGLTFIEFTLSGNPIVTTVFPAYKAGSREFIAVMSRHLFFMGPPLVSQYHGTCKEWGQ